MYSHQRSMEKIIMDGDGRFLPKSDLFKLIDHGHLEVLKQFRNLNFMAKDQNGNNLLHRAVMAEEGKAVPNFEMVQYLLQVVPKLAEETNNNGETALCYATTNAVLGIKMVDMLVKLYPRYCLSIPDHNGDTPLHHLVGIQLYEEQINAREWILFGRLLRILENTVTLLIDRGADINAEDKFGFTPLTLSLFGRFETYVYYDRVIEILIAKGANFVSRQGRHAICFVKSTNVARLILDTDSSQINVFDENGNTPLYYVIQNICFDLKDIIQLMFKHGAMVGKGTEIVLLARDLGYPFSIIEILLDNLPGYDVNVRDKNGASLLIQYGNDAHTIKKLLELGADVTQRDDEGRTAWTNSWKIEEPEGIMYLINAGADPTDGNILGVIWHRYCDKTDPSNKEQWFSLFTFLLSLPHFRAIEYLSKYLTDIIKRKIFSYRNYDQASFMQILTIVLDYCEEVYQTYVISKVPLVNGHTFHKAAHNVISLVLVHSDFLAIHHDESPDTEGPFPLEEFIHNLFDAGLSVSDVPYGFMSPLASLLTITHCPEYFEDTIYNLTKEFIVRGVNVEASALKIHHIENVSHYATQDMKKIKQNYYVPDALLIAYVSGREKIVKLLLPYFWGPPIMLLCFKPQHSTVTSIIEWFKYFAQYQYIPHGTLPSIRLHEIMLSVRNYYLNHLEVMTPVIREEIESVIHIYNELNSSPLTLRELCRFQVRHTLAKQALHPGEILEDLIDQVLEPPLQFLLY